MSCCKESNIVENNSGSPLMKNNSGCCGEKKVFTKYSLLKAGASIIRHLIDPKYDAFSSDEVKKSRIDACQKCDKITEFFGKQQCSVCKCFIEPKASLIDQRCPHPEGSKW